MFSVRTWLQGAVAGTGLAVAALAMPGAAQAVPVTGTQSLGALTTTSSLPHLALGDVLSNTGTTFFGGSQTGSFIGNVTAGDAVDDSTLTASLGASYTFTSSDGDFSGMITVNPLLHISGTGRTLSIFVLGTFTPAFGAFDPGPASMTIAYTETSNDSGSSFSYSATLASPPSNPPVPEPMTLALLGVGLVGLGVVRYRKN